MSGGDRGSQSSSDLESGMDSSRESSPVISSIESFHVYIPSNEEYHPGEMKVRVMIVVPMLQVSNHLCHCMH